MQNYDLHLYTMLAPRVIRSYHHSAKTI